MVDMLEVEESPLGNFKGFAVADLDRVFATLHSGNHWKAPWAAAVPATLVPLVLAAVEFYHADRAVIVGAEPVTGKVLMRGDGYQAW